MAGPDGERAPRKDRVVQARVPRALEATLKAEARRIGRARSGPRAWLCPRCLEEL